MVTAGVATVDVEDTEAVENLEDKEVVMIVEDEDKEVVMIVEVVIFDCDGGVRDA